MKKIGEVLYMGFNIVLVIFILSTYVFGLYTLVSNDRYSAKELVIGMAIPPYPIYIGFGELVSSLSGYDLYPYTVDEILGEQQIIELQRSGHNSNEIEHKAYKTLVTVLNNVKEEYRSEEFLAKFHNKEIPFHDLKQFTK